MEIIEDAAGVRLRETIPRVIRVAAPAPGADFDIPVQSGAMWFVESIVATLTTSAVVANRAPSIRIDDGSTTFCVIGGIGSQAASTSFIWSWMRNFGKSDFSLGLSGLNQAFPSIPLFSGFHIRSSTISLDAGDQWSGIVIYVLEVEERPFDVELIRDLSTLRDNMSLAFPQIPLET